MGKKKGEREHALLSASGAQKWLYCTPSAVLEDGIPDTESGYTREGALAHGICELKLSKLFTDKNMPDRTYRSRLKKLRTDEAYQPEMEGFTDEYVDYVSAIAFGFPSTPFVAVEKRLDYSPWAPEGFGTADCIIIYGRDMHVIDFKYGKGVPKKAEGNPQLAVYALGAWNEYGNFFSVEDVHLHIVQPRIPNTASWTVTLGELLSWGELFVKPRAELAYKGKGEFRPGDYCKNGFCKAYGRCRAMAEKNMALMADAIDPVTDGIRKPELMSNGEIGGILKRAQFLKDWVTKLENHALSELVKGGDVPGWKIVEGRSDRQLSDPDSAFRGLVAAGYDEAVLYNRKPIPLTELEKLVPKERRAELLAPYIIKPRGKPKFVPEDDKRPAMQPQVSAEEAFGGDNSYKER